MTLAKLILVFLLMFPTLLVRNLPDCFPGTSFKQIAARWHRLHFNLVEDTYNWAKAHQVWPSLFLPMIAFVLHVFSNRILHLRRSRISYPPFFLRMTISLRRTRICFCVHQHPYLEVLKDFSIFCTWVF